MPQKPIPVERLIALHQALLLFPPICAERRKEIPKVAEESNLIQFKRNIKMMRKPLFILTAFVVAVVCFVIYYYYRIPSGVTPKGESINMIAWVSLATAIVSMVTALIGLLKQILEMRSKKV